MLKDFMKANGLALEGEEPTAQIGEMVEAVETQGEEIEQAQSDIETTEEAVQTLESLVLAFESVAGDRTALEKHLFVGHVTTLYAQMGLAKPAQVSLESADGVTLSMEDFKETVKKVGDAIKAAWDKFVKMVKDFWMKLTDVAGRLKKKLQNLEGKAGLVHTILIDIKGNSSVHDPHKLANDMKEYLENTNKLAIDYISKYSYRYDIIVKELDDGTETVDFVPVTVGDYKEFTKTPFDGPDASSEATTQSTVKSVDAVKAAIAMMDTVSQYRRDWEGRQKKSEELVAGMEGHMDKFIGEHSKPVAKAQKEGKGFLKQAVLLRKAISNMTAEMNHLHSLGKRVCTQAVHYAKAVAVAVETARA